MDPRFVTRTIHAWLDYPVALMLMAAPFLLGMGDSNPAALWLGVGTGAAAFVLTILTDHELGVWRVLPYWFHLAVDFCVGVTFLITPVVLGFSGLDAWFYWANGGAVLMVVALHRPEGKSAGVAALGRCEAMNRGV